MAHRSEHVIRTAIDTAIDSVPEGLIAQARNVAVIVARECREDPDLYGLYEGIPLTERGAGDPVPPDIIRVFSRPLIEDFGHDPHELARQVRITVLHELGHHFGLDERALERLGWA